MGSCFAGDHGSYNDLQRSGARAENGEDANNWNQRADHCWNQQRSESKGMENNMDPLSIGIGVLLVGYGCFTTYRRATNAPESKKMQVMKKAWGDGGGTALYVGAYSVMPVLCGVVFIISGVMGQPFFN
ncbi:MAG: hypothetical protein N2C14_29395 [Planctomycetales bacterium]